jgi:hypothetical protein
MNEMTGANLSFAASDFPRHKSMAERSKLTQMHSEL